MTSDTVHDISPSFTWQGTYADQLRHIADTDEYCYDDNNEPSPSANPASSSRQFSDWPSLKDAIKYRITECLEQDLAGSQSFLLHPAAVLIPFVQDEGDNTRIIASSSSHTAVGDEDERSASPSRALDEDSRANGASATSSHAPPSQPPYVAPADTQDFFASKRQPISANTIPLTAEESAKQRRILFSMLDDFDLQPPFTMQRIAELVLHPRQYYRSPHKWIAALKRCLSVTATRDAFPISPVQTAVSDRMVNGHTEALGPDMSELDMDRLDGLPPTSTADDTMGVVTTVPTTTRSRSASTASINDPLFSPIPFLAKHESATSSSNSGANGDQMDVSDHIPDLELGGADRTQAQMPGTDSTPRELVDFAHTRTTPAAAASGSMGAPVSTAQKILPNSSTNTSGTGTSDEPDQDMSPTTATIAERVDEEMPSNVDLSTAKTETRPLPAAVPGTSSSDLGVPDGQIDEMDNPSHRMNPLSSTTTSVTSPPSNPTTPTTTTTLSTTTVNTATVSATQPTSSTPPTPSTPPTAPADSKHTDTNTTTTKTTTDTVQDTDSPRHTKRRKSVASIHE